MSQGFKGAAHRGIDVAAAIPGQSYLGADIPAAADGTVVEARSGVAGFGCWVWLQHTVAGKRVDTIHGHMYLPDLLVTAGQKVTAGQVIARVGNNGTSTAPHLHFEVWEGGRTTGYPVDPLLWVLPQPTDSSR